MGVHMSTTAPTSQPQHPLFNDPDRLEKILNAMYFKIHKVLGWSNPGRRSSKIGHVSLAGAGSKDRAIVGTGVGADDVLSEAFYALLRFSPDDLRDSWEGLAVTIAGNKAKDALKKANKGKGDHLQLVSGDAPATPGGDDRDVHPTVLDVYTEAYERPEDEFHALNNVVELRELARELLGERDQMIFLTIHTGSSTRRELGEELGLSGQRVGQIYDDALERLEAHPRYPYRDDDKGGQDDQGA